ncbi:PRC-barrel domain-containing protein [Pseudaminobacter sp. NGMCC 1.201702]|uniref:PRC-barrel domain-containing protein n=1 Tax=Pseudaminobacter sp. NGMCC 1.201702 TaxID=3391825 RepID=UPI0039EE1F2B
MIRNLLATTAIATLLTTAGYAQDTTAPAPADPAPMTQDAAPAEAPVARADGHLASNIIGENVYNGTSDDAQDIGKVNDVVIAPDGKVESVVIGVGGFLGLGEKNVAVNYSEIDWAERDGDRWLVVNTSKEQLEALADFDRRAYDPAPAASDSTAMAPADGTTTTAPADGTTAVAPTTPAPDSTAEAPATMEPDSTAEAPSTTAPDSTAEAPAGTDQTTTSAVDKSQLTEMPAGEIRSEDLVGTTVYGAEDANVGEIGDVVLTQDGKVDAVIIDVGGFLGIGSKEVAVAMDNLSFMTDKDGNKYLYTQFTQEQLEAQPAYDKATYTENRDEQRLMSN